MRKEKIDKERVIYIMCPFANAHKLIGGNQDV